MSEGGDVTHLDRLRAAVADLERKHGMSIEDALRWSGDKWKRVRAPLRSGMRELLSAWRPLEAAEREANANPKSKV